MSTQPSPAESPHEAAGTPRADLIGGLLWLALGIVITVMSWRMDRLQAQHVNPYTVPGLVPGLLGLAMLVLGTLMAVRGWRAGARLAVSSMDSQPASTSAQVQPGEPTREPAQAHRAIRVRIATVLGLCLLFGGGLVGHGLPFWAAAALFVTAAVLILQGASRKAAGVGLSLRTVLIAAVIGLGAGALVTLVFQEFFLVHLP
ncbi:tripartite tricarboxylate transporter TctB family protein [Burkholderia sp. L27(2015)]|uniref:tripartite tricarboxylate transporter TctB family protein n=1 Tax=Burkholderia sp. L27(2015) TaxID=1641858 RepID=UPI00131C2889|nr:tripartite tricarboxylate transporter TctB family protein [Burkholderia sp. L27(2015)]